MSLTRIGKEINSIIVWCSLKDSMGEDPCIRTLALTLSHKNNKELQKGLG